MPINTRPLRKFLLAAAATALATAACPGATTLQMGTTAGLLTGLANSSGQINQQLVWGLVIDTAGNGVQPGQYLSTSLTYTDSVVSPQGQSLSTTSGLTDDVLFISNNVMAIGSTTADNSFGLAKPSNVILFYANDPNFPSFNPTINPAGGQAFWIIWFDVTTKSGQAVAYGDHYGMYRIPALITPADTLGGAVAFGPNFAGPDPANIANFTFVPEPSSALLGLLGIVGLLRRRR